MEKQTSTVKPQWATHSHSLHTSPLSGSPSPTSSEEPGNPVSGLGEEGPYIILQSSSWSPGGSAHFASESVMVWKLPSSGWDSAATILPRKQGREEIPKTQEPGPHPEASSYLPHGLSCFWGSLQGPYPKPCTWQG